MKYLFLLLPFATFLFHGETLQVSSSAFKNGENIPPQFTCEGENISPALTIKGFPATAKSLAVIMEDPDAPNGTFVHWVMWNIPPKEIIAENTKPGLEGKNGTGGYGYTGPCPPNGKHHYHFKVYALPTMLQLTKEAGKTELLNAMNGHMLASGEIIGLYEIQKLQLGNGQ